MAKTKNLTDNIDSATLDSIEANSAFVKRFVTDYPISEGRWYLSQSYIAITLLSNRAQRLL